MERIFPLLPKQAYGLSRFFLPQGKAIARFIPRLKIELEQAEIKIKIEEYLALAFAAGTIFGILIFFLLFAFGSLITSVFQAFFISLITSVLFCGITIVYSILYPKVLIQIKVKLLEKDLLFALKYVLIKIKSGIPLYDAMVGVAEGDFGEVSSEFRKTVKEISTGTENITALEHMALRNPSSFFRRTIWQIANNMRSGVDVAKVLETITSTLVKEQKILIRKYGSELNPIILMYMMFCVIVPSLGITVIIIMSSFSGLEIPAFIFYLIPIFIFILQLFFTKIIKDKKPTLSM